MFQHRYYYHNEGVTSRSTKDHQRTWSCVNCSTFTSADMHLYRSKDLSNARASFLPPSRSSYFLIMCVQGPNWDSCKEKWYLLLSGGAGEDLMGGLRRWITATHHTVELQWVSIINVVSNHRQLSPDFAVYGTASHITTNNNSAQLLYTNRQPKKLIAVL